MSDVEEALSPYLPSGSLDVFYDKLPQDGERDYPIGFELWYLHTPISKPNKILLKLVCIENRPSARWKVVQHMEVENV